MRSPYSMATPFVLWITDHPLISAHGPKHVYLNWLIHFNEKSKISFIDQQLYDGIKVFDAHVNGLLDASAMLSYRKS